MVERRKRESQNLRDFKESKTGDRGIYEKVFFRHLVDALGSAEETQTWLEFAKDCGYLDVEEYQAAINEYEEICSILYALRKNGRKIER